VLGRSLFYSNIISDCQVDHDHNTRFRIGSNLNCPTVKISKSYCSFLYQGIMLWNSIPTEIKDSTSLFTFKRQLKLHLLDSV
jgi:hypothetical protein